MRTVTVQIAGRKDAGYPTLSIDVEFNSIKELITEIDRYIEEETSFRKVDVSIDDYDKVLTNAEADELMENFILIS